MCRFTSEHVRRCSRRDSARSARHVRLEGAREPLYRGGAAEGGRCGERTFRQLGLCAAYARLLRIALHRGHILWPHRAARDLEEHQREPLRLATGRDKAAHEVQRSTPTGAPRARPYSSLRARINAPLLNQGLVPLGAFMS